MKDNINLIGITLQELHNLIEQAYKAGYKDYETIEAGLQGYNPTSYAEHILITLDKKEMSILESLKSLFNTSTNKLTEKYLLSKGWICEKVGDNIYYVEKDIKERDKIWVLFKENYYMVYYGKDRTFIALNAGLEWFEVFCLVVGKE